MTAKKPMVLVILDGWGHREAPEDNAIYHANTPTWDKLWAERPRNLISGSGLDVGLPDGQMGNSEVGHMSLGAGRIMYQNITKIDKAIEDGDFFRNDVYVNAVEQAVSHDKAVHIFGLLSPGGVHSHENHILAAAELAVAQGATRVYVHAFLDGRDTPPRSAEASLQRLDAKFAELGKGRIASLVGRYYAMDRDNRWDRVQAAYDMLTLGEAPYRANSALEGLQAAYQRDEDDEFVKPTLIVPEGEQAVKIDDGDAILFMNFRADRAREITRAFTDADFDGFARKATPKLADFVATTEYSSNLNTRVAFPNDDLHNTFGELLASQGKTQLRIAETEKYAHVTFFFSGGREELYEGEERILVPSPDVATYDLKPEMSAPEVTDKLVEAIKSGNYDAIIVNYANGDMVGHTGVFDAAIKAAEAIDESLRRVTEAVLEVGGDCLITADHGNCEQMLDYKAKQPHTQHTTELVPFVYVGPRQLSLKPGRLPDVAPTMLALMGLEQPPEMTGHSLVEEA
ncbi:2,3-bisphosphoglycerate-independent phosphoglycerate mutase [Litorivivens sp.]|uniref:2,3-bisphosphoglycerate-independent phosphoglycerate mutase n=1 Tax=Litorivivens sp. TaxID=2020868 RepID=UPI003568219C